MSNNLVQELFDVIKDRKTSPVEKSYTNYLFEKGIDKILKKVGEEASEVIISSKNDDNSETVMEICDLIYHVLVLMAEKGIELEDVVKELEVRRAKIGNKKPERVIE
jgi:phosphoribosyl-ATP pyrophosphohydrolase